MGEGDHLSITTESCNVLDPDEREIAGPPSKVMATFARKVFAPGRPEARGRKGSGKDKSAAKAACRPLGLLIAIRSRAWPRHDRSRDKHAKVRVVYRRPSGNEQHDVLVHDLEHVAVTSWRLDWQKDDGAAPREFLVLSATRGSVELAPQGSGEEPKPRRFDLGSRDANAPGSRA